MESSSRAGRPISPPAMAGPSNRSSSASVSFATWLRRSWNCAVAFTHVLMSKGLRARLLFEPRHDNNRPATSPYQWRISPLHGRPVFYTPCSAKGPTDRPSGLYSYRGRTGMILEAIAALAAAIWLYLVLARGGF